MSNPFVAATKVQKRLKVLVYGESGAGKTWFALSFPGKVAVIDTEGGTELYGGREDVQAFDVVRTKSYEEVMSALAFIQGDGGKTYQTVVVDPITVIYQVLQEVASKNSKMKDGAIDMRGWGIIKNKMNRLYVALTNLPCHVVIVSRLKDQYETKGSELVRVGVKPDSEKSTPYLFDIVLRIENGREGRLGWVEKDRSGTLGKTIASPDFAALAHIAEAYSSGEHVEHTTEEDAADKDAETMAGEFNPHWISDPDTRKRFWRWVKDDMALTEDEVHEALDVAHIEEYPEGKAEAMRVIQGYASDKWSKPRPDVGDGDNVPR